MYNDLTGKIVGLICRDIFGKLDDEGSRELRDWIGLSDANRRMYEEIRSGKGMDDFMRRFGDVTGERIIAGVRETVRRRSRRRWLLISSSAACAIAAAVALWGPLRMTDNTVMPITTVHANAILSTPNGKQIILSEQEQDSKWQEFLIPAEDFSDISEPAGPSKISITVPRGNKFRIELTDGTKVWLNEESFFEYPERFDGGSREVVLIGEAYFDVAKDGARDFVVSIDDGVSVKVLGTKFNIRDYSDTPQISIALIEGSVEVARNGASVVLKPDETATIMDGQEGIGVATDPNVAKNMEWIYGLFEFEARPLREIVNALAEWYGLETDYDRQTVNKFREVSFHAVRHENYDKVLSSLSTITGLNIHVTDNKLTVSKK